jgi:cytochrome P450
MSQPIPEPPELGIINGVRFARRTFGFLEGIQSRYEDLAAVPLPGRSPLVVITNPSLVHEALDRPEDFPRVPVQDTAAMISERGLVQSEGDLWQQQRSIMAPAFSGRQVKAYANTTGRRADALADTWEKAGEQSVNLHREMTALTVRVASEILLGEDIGADRARQFNEWMQIAGTEFEFGLGSITPDWVPERTSPAFERAAAGIRQLADDLIAGRRAAIEAGDVEGPTDMLTMLIRAEDTPDVEYPKNQIRDEVTTFLIAGHETTALSLAYTLTLLSNHPEARRRVREEAREALGDGSPTHDDLTELGYTQRAYREALRLYPPAPAIFRQADGDAVLGDYLVEDGSAIVMPLWSIHRDERYFENPLRFDPDRWERRDPTSVEAYRPFSTGPHACIGRQFALSGATLTIARLVRDFDVEVPETELDDLRFTITLRPRDGIDATIRPVE